MELKLKYSSTMNYGYVCYYYLQQFKERQLALFVKKTPVRNKIKENNQKIKRQNAARSKKWGTNGVPKTRTDCDTSLPNAQSWMHRPTSVSEERRCDSVARCTASRHQPDHVNERRRKAKLPATRSRTRFTRRCTGRRLFIYVELGLLIVTLSFLGVVVLLIFLWWLKDNCWWGLFNWESLCFEMASTSEGAGWDGR